MKRNSLHKSLSALFAFCLLFEVLHAQKGTQVTPDQMMPLTQHVTTGTPATALRARPQNPTAPQRTANVFPDQIGTMANAFSSSSSANNCVFADDSTGTVLFIHRSNPALHGGSAFSLRYDISTDAGTSWNIDIGELNPTTLSGRYPQVAGYHAPGSNSALPGAAIWVAEHYDAGFSTWSGFNAGATQLVTSGTPTTQETIVSTTEHLPSGGMCEGLPGEYWLARFSSPGATLGDSLIIYKGQYNTGNQSIAWSLHAAQTIPWSVSFDGAPHALSPTIAFSPDGMTGWVATLGDLAAGSDSLFAPILLKSTDAGATWGAPVEVDLNSFPWVYDSLRALWVDSLGNPASTGRATAAFDYDLTVDAAGNPHLFFVIGTGTDNQNSPAYSIFSGLAKYAVDLTSINQGSTFDLRLVAPILTFRSPTYGSTATTMSMDNYPQVSRTADGGHIFYSWVDSDTAQFTGNMNGVGFGTSDNLAPNLWMSGLRLSDGYFTCIHSVTAMDLIWEGRAINPQMAPEVLVTGTGPSTTYHLPIVITEMPAGEPADPCNNFYFGDDAALLESDFSFSPGSTITWLGCGVSPGTAAHIRGKVFVDYNGNGLFDGADSGIPGTMVTTTGVTYAGMANTAGDYHFAVAPNATYGLVATPMNTIAWTPTAPAVPYILTPGPLANLTGNDFGFQPVSNVQDLSVAVVLPFLRPGFTTTGTIYVDNLGTMPTTGTLTFTYDSLVSISSANPSYASNDTITRTVTWNLPTIPILQRAAFTVGLYIPPTVPLNSTLAFSAQVTSTGQDIDLYNNSDIATALVIGSFDPNDKAVTPAGEGSNHQVAPGTELSYRIRCQNTGNAAAINVVIRDTLDANLDISTFKMLGSSHSYDLDIQNGRYLSWDFPNINLPDSFSNEPGSHAYIDFSIRPKANRPLGTVVENSAAIYFDFNAPVVTNTAWITYDVTSSAVHPSLPQSAVLIYPHPIGNSATVALQGYAGKPWTFELYDLQGRCLLQSGPIATATYPFERRTLPAGAYVYKVATAGNLPKMGRILLE